MWSAGALVPATVDQTVKGSCTVLEFVVGLEQIRERVRVVFETRSSKSALSFGIKSGCVPFFFVRYGISTNDSSRFG